MESESDGVEWTRVCESEFRFHILDKVPAILHRFSVLSRGTLSEKFTRSFSLEYWRNRTDGFSIHAFSGTDTLLVHGEVSP